MSDWLTGAPHRASTCRDGFRQRVRPSSFADSLNDTHVTCPLERRANQPLPKRRYPSVSHAPPVSGTARSTRPATPAASTHAEAANRASASSSVTPRADPRSVRTSHKYTITACRPLAFGP